MAIHFDTQGPAPDGFHVPLSTEWQAVYDVWTALGGGSSDGTNFGIALKLPFAGYRLYSDANVYSQGTNGNYWSSSRCNEKNAYYLFFNSTSLIPQRNLFRANGYSVRCFKNSFTAPTSNTEPIAGPISSGAIAPSTTGPTLSLWTATKSCTCVVSGVLWSGDSGGDTWARLYKNGTQIDGRNSGLIYGTKNFEMQVSVVPGDILTLGTSRGSSGSGSVNDVYVSIPDWTVINGTLGSAGIFRNQADGLISITSDGATGYTIQDKNLGATTVWNSGDTLSEANCGKYYQWGNNYGFDRNSVDPIDTSSTQVDASNYGPGNYYSSDKFIKYNGRWDTTDNGNLRGGVSQGTWGYPDMRLHGAIQTFHRAPSGPSLKSYEEIVAMSINNALIELNTHPTEYYDKFNSEGHIYVKGNMQLLGSSQQGAYNFSNSTHETTDNSNGYSRLYYDSNNTWTINAYSPGSVVIK